MAKSSVKTAKALSELTDQQFGDWFEGRVQSALEVMMRTGPTFYQRLYDTRSAGGFLPAQPGDFIGVTQGTGWLLEVKASGKYGSLADGGALRSLVKDHQALGGYLMTRASGKSLFVFYGRHSRQLEVWDGAAVRETYVVPRAKLQAGLIRSGTMAEAEQDDMVNVLASTLTGILSKKDT